MTGVLTQQNLDFYGAGDIAWCSVLEQFEAGMAERFWLATVRPDGHPHLVGIGARGVDGAVWPGRGLRRADPPVPAARPSRRTTARPARGRRRGTCG